MKLSESAIKALAGQFEEEIRKVSESDDGSFKTLGELEDITTEIGRKLQNDVLQELIANESLKGTVEKKMPALRPTAEKQREAF